MHTSHSFIDDLLYGSTESDLIEKVIDFYDTSGIKLGIDMNMSKIEAQALNGAERQNFTSPNGPVLNTHDPTTKIPRELYEYPGFYIFTNKHVRKPLALKKHQLSSFFAPLLPNSTYFIS